MTGVDIMKAASNGQELTEEQEAILAESPDKTIVVEAAAGSGKTSTLVSYSRKWRQKRGLYLSFNRDIAEEARQRFPAHIKVKTAHGYAFNALGIGRYKSRLTGRIKRNDVKLAGFDLRSDYLPPDRMMRAVLDGITNFCIDAGTEFLPRHCGLERSPPMVQEVALRQIAAVVKKFLDYETSGLPFTHDIYLKRLEMTGSIGAEVDYLLVDESQDLNPVLISLIKKSGRPAIIVGDPKQCLAPGEMVLTPGGLVAVEDIKTGDVVVAAHGRGSIKQQKVTRVHRTKALNGLVKITTTGGRTIRSTPDHTHFAGFRKDVGQTGWNVYLMYRDSFGYRIGMSQSYLSHGRLVNGWISRVAHENADHVFVIASGLEREQAAVMEQVLSLRYGIPTNVFKDRGQTAFGKEYLHQIYDQIDTMGNARRLMADYGIDERAPHHRPKATLKNRRNFSITMCADRGLHRYAISGSDPTESEILRSIGIETRSSKAAGWRIESSTKDLKAIYDLHERISAVLPVNLVEAAQFAGARSIPLIPAGNCLPGMEMFVYDDNTGKIETDRIAIVEREAYEGDVFDLDIEHSHNFIANGIVTHNSIYAFRGAVNAFESFDGPRFPLSQSWRFGEDVAVLANHILSHSDSPPPHPIRGRPDRETSIELYDGKAPAKAFILARTNSRLFEGLVKIQVPFYVAGGFDVLASQLLSAWALFRNDQWNVTDGYVRSFTTWDEFAEEGEHDPDARRLAKIITDYGAQIPGIIDRLRGLQQPSHHDAQIMLSTAHKAKGLEADTVVICDDFETPNEIRARLLSEKIDQISYEQEINLLYVACSRPRYRLMLPPSLYEVAQEALMVHEEKQKGEQ